MPPESVRTEISEIPIIPSYSVIISFTAFIFCVSKEIFRDSPIVCPSFKAVHSFPSSETRTWYALIWYCPSAWASLISISHTGKAQGLVTTTCISFPLFPAVKYAVSFAPSAAYRIWLPSCASALLCTSTQANSLDASISSTWIRYCTSFFISGSDTKKMVWVIVTS